MRLILSIDIGRWTITMNGQSAEETDKRVFYAVYEGKSVYSI